MKQDKEARMIDRTSIRHAAVGLPVLLAVFLIYPQSLAEQATATEEDLLFSVVINELLADNHSGLKDEDGERFDWLELHNYGQHTVKLENAYLTDSRKDLTRWQFPDIDLAAGGYLVVFLSGKDRRESDSPLHTSFSIKSKGDYLGLVEKDGVSIVHDYAREFPKQKKDISYGLSPDWNSAKSPNLFQCFPEAPSPGTQNLPPVLGDVKGVKFSVKRGWHRESFKLSLKTKTRGAEIRYTLDGSPPSIGNGTPYTSPIQIDRSTTLRAGAFKARHRSSSTATRTYLFVEDVISQSADGLPPTSFPYSWGKNKVNYGMDQRIVSDSKISKELIDGFYSLPSFSIVMNVDDLFDEESGIYANADRDGREAERTCSMELIHADGTKGFQIDCGIRMRGGFSRRADNPKHSFRFFFRDIYGPSKLDYPLFGESGADQFDHIDLRTFQNYAWHLGSREAIFLRDQFCRDLQLDLGQAAARGEFCHLFLNGQYWGVYNTCERIKASYGAAYFGGKKDDFDSIKHGRGGVMTNDGNLESWKRLWTHAKAGLKKNQSYFEMLGRNPDGSENPDLECLLDVDNLIDYMFVIFYGGNYDGPVSAWGNNRGPNNWYGLRNRESRDGFRFFVWDAEHSLRDVREDRTGPFPAGEHFGGSNPQWLWQQCLENEEFRVRVGDRIQKHFHGDGALTADSVRRRFIERAKDVESAALCESARWGDAAFTSSGGRSPDNREPRTREKHWQPEIDRIANEYIPARSEIILAQLFGHGVISDVETPKHRFVDNDKHRVHLESQHGIVYYTNDGSDPRLIEGGINPSSQAAEDEVIGRNLEEPLLARTWFRDEWSALSIIP
jgi:hypothetical protein